MRRSLALRNLSRDHHQSLVVARSLLRATDDRAGALALRWWHLDGKDHFRIEEEILLPGWMDSCSQADAAMVTRVLAEHALIRADFSEYERFGLGMTGLAELGQSLQRHIRFEERILFPQIERSMGEAELTTLAERVRAAGSTGGAAR